MAGVDHPLTFETERDIALAAAPLVEVATVLPGADQWVSHTADYTGHRPFTLFDGLQPIGHELYLAHDVLFALDGHCEVQVQLELAADGGNPIDTIWEYWDGETWMPFASFLGATQATDANSIDGTAGLTRSGTVVLRVDGAKAKRRVVNWVESYWIRARCAKALTPDAGPHLPTVSRVLVASVIAPPIGTLRFQGVTDPTQTDLGQAKTLLVSASSPVSLSPDPTGATVSITQLSVEDGEVAHAQTGALSGNYANLGPVPPTAEGKYLIQVVVPGFTTLIGTITMKAAATARELMIEDTISNRRPDKGASSSLPLDLTKPFLPFGANPQPGAAFYLMAADAFSKPGAKVTMLFDSAATGPAEGTPYPADTVDAQYFDGEDWQDLPVSTTTTDLANLISDGGTLQFTVPDYSAPTAVNGVDGYWIRIRIQAGTYGLKRVTKIGTAKSAPTFTTYEVLSPAVKSIHLAYYWRSPWQAPSACQTCNDFEWIDRSATIATSGAPFAPFTVIKDVTPAVYFGFDGALPTDVLSMFVDVDEVAGDESGPDLVWECVDGADWLPISVEDETGALALPGTVRMTYPGITVLPTQRGIQTAPDTVQAPDLLGAGRLRAGDHVSVGDDNVSEYAIIASVANGVITFASKTAKKYPRATVTKCGPARFGTPRASWIRARLRTDGDPRHSRLSGVYPNATWAANIQTHKDEVLGTSDGNPDQTLALRYYPVLPHERLEVLELSGPRAVVDIEDLRADVLAHGGSADDVRGVNDPVTHVLTQVWVRWLPQRNLYFSGPADRHYTIERSHGVVRFGDDKHGRIPPTSPDGIIARVYRAGGGRVGNIAAGAINQLLSGIPAASVTNVRPAEGGADTETTAAVSSRGPESVAARVQATTAADYEVLAREASPAVALARALQATDATGRRHPGYVCVIIVPDSPDPKPMPSFGLRREVELYLRRRCPAAMAGNVYVVAPQYQPVGVLAEITPRKVDDSGPTVQAVHKAIGDFLHPLRGGPDGTGWGFGRDVYLSDLARVIGGVDGVDHVRTLELLLDGSPQGQVVRIAVGRIVVADALTVRLAGGE